jgi:hypothetical protein
MELIGPRFVAFIRAAGQDATPCGIRVQHRRADADRITPRRPGVGQSPPYPGEDRLVHLDVDPMQRARHRPVVRHRLVQREVQELPQARRVGRLLALVGIATLSVVVSGCGGARSPAQPIDSASPVGLIDSARIPGAPELGRVEVERRHSPDGLGWQCETTGHLDRVSFVIANTEELDSTVWNRALRTWVLKRLTEYYPEHGKPGLRGRDRSFSWRDWLGGTLERINAAADEAGLPQKEKETRLQAWVACHVSVTEAIDIRGQLLASEKEGR